MAVYLQADKLVQVGLGQHVHSRGEGLGDLRREIEGTGLGVRWQAWLT